MATPNIPGSFRDPSGFVFLEGDQLYRQVNTPYRENYDLLIQSGLYQDLVEKGWLISHEEIRSGSDESDIVYKVLRPEKIPFISYPFEWCFSQLRDAALLTLLIQKKALDFGLSLKDCSAYNIQFKEGTPVFIDTLSFERYQEGRPWKAYRQFCQHFLGPLALMRYKDVRLSQLFRVYLDGPPIDLVSALLPFSTHFRFSLMSHIHLHSRSQKYFSDKNIKFKSSRFGRLGFVGLVDSLESAVRGLTWKPESRGWTNYDEEMNYSPEAFNQKKQLVDEFLDRVNPLNLWDLGANTGQLSRIAGDKGIKTISFDLDPGCVELNYLQTIKQKESNILPLVLDLTNPSPGLGWANEERMSLMERGPADLVLALALIHHLSIGNNVPFDKIAYFFSKLGDSLIIEFVPKTDSQVQKMLSNRKDIFTGYSQTAFEAEFEKYFSIEKQIPIIHTERVLYLMKKIGR